MKTQALLFSVLLLLFGADMAHAEPADVVPKGVYRFQLSGIATEVVENGFSEDGKYQSLVHDLNRDITSDDFAKTDPRVKELITALNALSPGLGDELLLTNIISDIEVSQKLLYAGLSYGVTKNFTMSIVAPVIQRSISVNLQAETTNNATAVRQSVGELSSELSDGLGELAGEALDGEFFKDKIFREKGYVLNSKQEESSLGDIELRGRYRYLRKRKHVHSLEMGVVFPTGKPRAIDNIFDPGSGSGKWSVLVENRDQWYFDRRRNHSLDLKTGVLFSLADQRERAIPKDEEDDLPSLLPEDGQVQLSTERSAPRFLASLGMTNQFYRKRINVESSVTYETQGKSQFQGPGDLFYEGLEGDTGYSKLAAELAVGYSSVYDYMRTKKGIPFQALLRYNKTLGGANTEDVSYIRTDLVLFFK